MIYISPDIFDSLTDVEKAKVCRRILEGKVLFSTNIIKDKESENTLSLTIEKFTITM